MRRWIGLCDNNIQLIFLHWIFISPLMLDFFCKWKQNFTDVFSIWKQYAWKWKVLTLPDYLSTKKNLQFTYSKWPHPSNPYSTRIQVTKSYGFCISEKKKWNLLLKNATTTLFREDNGIFKCQHSTGILVFQMITYQLCRAILAMCVGQCSWLRCAAVKCSFL